MGNWSPETKFMVKVFNKRPNITFEEMKAAAEKAAARGVDIDLEKIRPITYGVAKRAAGLTGDKPKTETKKAKKKSRVAVATREDPLEPEPTGNDVMGSINRLISEHEKLKAVVQKFIGEAQAIVGPVSVPTDEDDLI